MSMERYLCQLCWSVVHYGETHPCFFYKNEGLVYTVPPPNEYEEVERRQEGTQETHSRNWNKDSLNVCQAAQTNHGEEYEEKISSPIEDAERISLVPAWETKRRHESILSGNKRGEPEDTKKQAQVQRKKKYASAEATRRVDSSGIGEATCSSAQSSVAVFEAENVVEPSGIRTQSPGSENERAFVCALCGRSFSGIGRLNKHRITQACEKRFACSMCDRAFDRKSNLDNHLRIHTGEKPFPCDFCGKRCSTKHHLVIHRRTHTGEKPYKCKRCGRYFADPSVCRRHLKKCTAKIDAHLGAKK